MPVAARVVGDCGRGRSASQRKTCPPSAARAALFDGRHDLELTQAQVSTLAQAPGGTVDAEDVGDLQGGARHTPLWGRQGLQGTDHLAQHLRGHVRIERQSDVVSSLWT